MNRVNRDWLVFVVCSLAATPVSASVDFTQYGQNVGEETGVYARAPIQAIEFGVDDGFALRSGYSRLDYLRESQVYLKGGVFAGLRYSLFDGPAPTQLKYEWGVTAFPFEVKVVTGDFRRYAFYLGYTASKSESDNTETLNKGERP